MAKFCSNCGSPVAEGAAFCTACGARTAKQSYGYGGMAAAAQLLDSMYSGIGAKIKRFAKVSFLVETVSAVIVGFGLLIDEEALTGLLILLCGPVVAWVSSWLLYAFGEIAENLCSIERNTRESAAAAAVMRKESEKARIEEIEKKRRESEEYIRKNAQQRAEKQAQARAKTEAALQQKAEKQADLLREQTLADKLQYALRYETQEGMVKYLKTLDDAAVQAIVQGPVREIRSRIEQLLSTL